MESTPYQRLEEFWLSKGLKNMSAFAEAIKRPPGTLSALKHRGSRPGNDVMASIIQAFPDLSPDYVLWGNGPMLRDDRALTKAETFFPTGRVNSLGAEEVSEGEMEAYLGADFGEDNGKPMGKGKPVVTKEDFIQGLLKEIEAERKEKKQLQAVNEEQKASLKSMQKTIDFLQNAVEFLQGQVEQLQVAGKIDGNHYDAPGTYAVAEPVNPIGFGRGARASYKNKSKKRHGKVIPMYAGGQLDVLHGESGLKAA